MFRSIPKKLYVGGLLLTVVLLSAYTVLVNPMSSNAAVIKSWWSPVDSKIQSPQSKQLYDHAEALLNSNVLPNNAMQLAQSNRLYDHAEALLNTNVLPNNAIQLAQSNRLYDHAEALLNSAVYPLYLGMITPPQ
jgi:hypothetical protein